MSSTTITLPFLTIVRFINYTCPWQAAAGVGTVGQGRDQGRRPKLWPMAKAETKQKAKAETKAGAGGE